ncbi:MAG: hypothetical protein PHS93_08025 [Candidatus Omnitrophica bacterium]|nr:hypothetical protein [Candidatus Omnitrophota bacterium]MDD5353090.1 hypothetical protein [Candidatus Omnitrophota bacterium]
MYTANILEIDGLPVITGIDKKGIDQVETEKSIKPYLQESSEQRAIEARQNQIRVYVKNIEAVTSQEKQLLFVISSEKGLPVNLIEDKHITFAQREQFQKYKEKKDFNRKQIETLQQDLPALNEKLKAKRLSLITEHAVYFETPGGQVDLTASQAYDFNKKLCAAVQYFNQTQKRRLVLLTGEVVDDLRGKIAWNNINMGLDIPGEWKKRIIQFLNEKIETFEVLEDDLTDEQKKEIAEQLEADRIANFTPEEKELEKQSRIGSVLNESIAMRSRLEIQRVPDALEQAQDWYDAELIKIEDKYK